MGQDGTGRIIVPVRWRPGREKYGGITEPDARDEGALAIVEIEAKRYPSQDQNQWKFRHRTGPK